VVNYLPLNANQVPAGSQAPASGSLHDRLPVLLPAGRVPAGPTQL